MLSEVNDGTTMDSYKLCFIKEQWAYFTKKSITGNDCQTGDDWNDIPASCNASPPYADKPGDIVMVAFKSELQTPFDYQYTAPYSADMINSGAIPWLMDYYGDFKMESSSSIKIMAGCTLEDFIDTILEIGGEIYMKVEEVDEKVNMN
jgi:hypothetical protein